MDVNLQPTKELSDDQRKKLWNEGTFIFDTNIFINLYNYSMEDIDNFFSIIDKVKDRIWMPHQVAHELSRHSSEAFLRRKSEGVKIISNMQDKVKFLRKEIQTLQRKHLDNDVIDRMIADITSLESHIESIDEDTLNFTHDILAERILSFFQDNMGDPYSFDELSEIVREGEIRYKLKIPPGYEDSKKERGAYGDYIMWTQVINYAKESKRPICFVTNETKTDWIETYDIDKTILNPQLVYEMDQKAGVLVDSYNLTNFLRYADKLLHVTVDPEFIEDTRKFRLYPPGYIPDFSGLATQIALIQNALSNSVAEYVLSDEYQNMLRAVDQINQMAIPLINLPPPIYPPRIYYPPMIETKDDADTENDEDIIDEDASENDS